MFKWISGRQALVNTSDSSQPIIRLLTQKKDLLLFRLLFLEAMQTHPEAFRSSFERESKLTKKTFLRAYSGANILGAFIQNTLVAYAVFLTNTSIKVRHRACLFSLYTNENYRNQGIGDGLIKAVIAHLKPHISQLHLSVVSSNHAAIHLYEKNGFKSYGIEPRSFKIDGQFYDEQLLVLMFESP